MKKILKEYWTFTNNLRLKPYYLGQIIDIKSESENLRKSDGDYDYEYTGYDDYLWIVSIKNTLITQIIYKRNFPFPSYRIWDEPYDVIRENLVQVETPINGDYSGDRMCVVVKDGFVSLIMLQRK